MFAKAILQYTTATVEILTLWLEQGSLEVGPSHKVETHVVLDWIIGSYKGMIRRPVITFPFTGDAVQMKL